jgi:hypothetical protein
MKPLPHDLHHDNGYCDAGNAYCTPHQPAEPRDCQSAVAKGKLYYGELAELQSELREVSHGIRMEQKCTKTPTEAKQRVVTRVSFNVFKDICIKCKLLHGTGQRRIQSLLYKKMRKVG